MCDGARREDVEELIAEDYKEQTGRELPDHVLENLELLTGTNIDRQSWIGEYRKRATSSEEDLESAEVAVVFIGWVGASGLAGVYASRWFDGHGAQILSGVFIAMVAFTVIGYVLRWSPLGDDDV